MELSGEGIFHRLLDDQKRGVSIDTPLLFAAVAMPVLQERPGGKYAD